MSSCRRLLVALVLLASLLSPAAVVRAQSGICFGDLNADGSVGSADLSIVLSAWGPCPGNSCGADTNGDGAVNSVDVETILDRWGACAPAIATITPASGLPKGGTVLTITGSWLGTTTAVTIGGVPATSFTIVNSSTLTVVTPPSTVGPKPVSVTTAGGTATRPNGFTYAVPWYTVIEYAPDPAVVINPALRDAIVAAGYPWRVRDNGTGIEMLLVPPGSFDMGCIQGSNSYGCYSFEQPVHTVTLTNAYYIGRYEVTQAQWQAKMGSNPSYFRESNGFPNSANRPVEQVSWNTIQGFLSATGLRLPTEAEWEYACRAGTTTPFHSGPGFPNGTTDDNLVSQIAWFNGNSGGNTWPVGGKAANALGVHDMLGNVFEWCNDWYGDYSSAAQTNPAGPASGSNRVLRGGSWLYGTLSVRSSYRYGSPVDAAGNVGFRVARAPL